jgi:probable HAF family extracellular repeat protein
MDTEVMTSYSAAAIDRRRILANKLRLLVTAALITSACLIPQRSLSATASFQPLGLGPGGVASRAWDVSADGSVVVGTFWAPSGFAFPPHAYRWTAGTFQDLGTLNPNAQEAEAYAVSDDGSKVIGWSRGVSGFQRPFVWTAATGMQELSNVPGSDAKATDVSRDGSVIVGSFYVDAEGSWHAFRSSGGVVTDLGFVPGGRDSKAQAVSGLGAAVVGSTVDNTGIQHAFRWQNGAMQDLGGVGKNSLAYAEDCSDDGSVVAGTSTDDKGNLLATRWSPNKILSLGTLGGAMSEAHATSADGSVVVGGAGLPFVNGISEFSAFRWTSATGRIEQLSRVLQNLGVNNVTFCNQVPCPAGTWFLSLALGISPDGSVIVGEAADSNGNQQAFRTVVPTNGGGGGGGACANGFTQLTLTVATAPGAPAGSVASQQNSSSGLPLVVASGKTGSACFQSNNKVVLQAANKQLADWSGNPAISCKNGNFGQNQCELLVGTTSQSVTATLK